MKLILSCPMLVTKLMFSSDSEYEQEAKKKKRDLSSDCLSSDRDSESEPEPEKKKKKDSSSVEKRSGKREIGVIGETNGSKEAFCKFCLGGYKSLWYHQVKALHDEPHVQRILDTSCPKEQSRLKSTLCHKGNF